MDLFNNPAGSTSLFQQLAQGFAGPRGGGNPSAYDEYLRAYSMIMLPDSRGERANVAYGGKIIMPPSSLANLTNLELEGPWMFKLRNPANTAATTHAGVLEFIAPEGNVYLPQWMMKTLRLEEGDPIRITGTELPKGRFVKLQAQSVHFLEISDHKAVLENALRNFSALTQGDIIEIEYNSIIFGLLVMEATPSPEGISVVDTDLEVDFAPPVGYVEPERPKPPPPSTMASKLKIDLESASPGSSRPTSSLGGGFTASKAVPQGVSKDGDHWESFKGRGQTLSGRKTKGKGISHRGVEEVPEHSKIIRTDKHRIVNNDTLEENVKVPAALNLPFGKLFFGFNVTPYRPPEPKETPSSPGESSQVAFSGSGATLNGRGLSSSSSAAASKKKEPEKQADWGSVGTGNRLGRGTGGATGAGGASVPKPPQRSAGKGKQRERSPTPDFGVDDDDDVIMIDSD